MNPGPDLDALVAEKVMGWDVDGTSVFVDGKAMDRAWSPSMRITDAWRVVDKLTSIPMEVTLSSNGNTGMWHVLLYEWDEDTRDWVEPDWCRNHPVADTAPHAICLAALMAVGEKEKEMSFDPTVKGDRERLLLEEHYDSADEKSQWRVQLLYYIDSLETRLLAVRDYVRGHRSPE